MKVEGPLPRLRDDSMPLTVLPSYKAKNSWAKHKALAGQNDYRMT